MPAPGMVIVVLVGAKMRFTVFPSMLANGAGLSSPPSEFGLW